MSSNGQILPLHYMQREDLPRLYVAGGRVSRGYDFL
jgi:hypothetical protein